MKETILKMKFGFIPYGLILFFIIMIPNFIWFGVPAPNDVLRGESITPVIDVIASICQIFMVATLGLIINTKASTFRIKSKWILSSAVSAIVYFIGWSLYYIGVTHEMVILILCIAPCLAFLFYEIDRRNWIALGWTIGFMVLHTYYGVINFIVSVH